MYGFGCETEVMAGEPPACGREGWRSTRGVGLAVTEVVAGELPVGDKVDGAGTWIWVCASGHGFRPASCILGEAGQSSRGVDLFACQSLGQGPRAIL